VRLWDAATGEERAILTGHTSEVESAAFSPNGSWLVSASTDGSVRVWEVASRTEIGKMPGDQGYALSSVFSPDGTVLASGGGDHALHVWDWQAASGVAIGRDRFSPIGHGGWVLTVAFSPDGAIVASAGVATTSWSVAPGDVSLYSADSGFPLVLLRGHTQRVTSIAFNPDGKLLASGSADGSVRLWGVVHDPSWAAAEPTSEGTQSP
jgi:WD40 repeat protein